jgi:hypothetical protein
MSSSEFKIAGDFRSLTTRESGVKARISVLRALESDSFVVLDFSDAQPSPSFADELVGGLAATLGRDAFLRCVRIVGIDEAVRPLLNHIVANRLKQGRTGSDDTSVHRSNPIENRKVVIA